MEINSLLCELLDTDSGFDNKELADKIEKLTDDFSVRFAKWCVVTQAFEIYGFDKALDVFKNE